MLLALSLAVTESLAQDLAQNYIRQSIMLDNQRGDSIVEVQYYDGLGRPTQKVAGGLNTDGLFIYTQQEYDSAGHPVRSWAPIIGGSTPDYKNADDIPAESLSTYGEDFAFSLSSYDALAYISLGY